MLERFRSSKQKELATLRTLAEKGALPSPLPHKTGTFAHALRTSAQPLAVIAEYKRASPSRGVIRENLDVETVARAYQQGGASALSILTEEDWFLGSFSFLDRAAAVAGPLPILRKDFIFDELQIHATAASSASAVLLIARLLPDAGTLQKMRLLAEKLGLDAVIEVFAEKDLGMAREAGAKIIQVNARDLDTLAVDRDACLSMIRHFPPQNGELWIAASGMEMPQHLRAAADAGFHAALIGASLMASPDPGQGLAHLLQDSSSC